HSRDPPDARRSTAIDRPLIVFLPAPTRRRTGATPAGRARKQLASCPCVTLPGLRALGRVAHRSTIATAAGKGVTKPPQAGTGLGEGREADGRLHRGRPFCLPARVRRRTLTEKNPER